MDKSFAKGHVLVLSIWDDHAANMLWLDSDYPVGASTTTPGVARGACATSSGVPADIEAASPNASVTFSNIKFGDIGSTYGSGSTPTTPTTSAPATTTTASSGTVAHYGQCGGIGYTGPTACVSPYTCVKNGDYYSQCL
ncbi:1,4-beta-D-glucan cellobiohydrolase B, putative, partial [Rhizoctonia solani AG-3 Rhs1AP]